MYDVSRFMLAADAPLVYVPSPHGTRTRRENNEERSIKMLDSMSAHIYACLVLSCAFQGVENCPHSGESKQCVDSSLKCLPALSDWLRITRRAKRTRLVDALRFRSPRLTRVNEPLGSPSASVTPQLSPESDVVAIV